MDRKEMDVNTRSYVDSAQDSDYWRDLMNAAMNLRVSLDMESISYYCIFLLFKLGDKLKISFQNISLGKLS